MANRNFSHSSEFVFFVACDTMSPRFMRNEPVMVYPLVEARIGDDVLVGLMSGETLFGILLSHGSDVLRLGRYNAGEVEVALDDCLWMHPAWRCHPLEAAQFAARVN